MVTHRRRAPLLAQAVRRTSRPPAPTPQALPGRLGRGVLVNYSTVALTGVATLILTRILLDHLGASEYGVYILAGSVVGYLELLELGFGTATTKLLAEDADRRPLAVLRTLNTNVAVLLALGAVAAVLGVAISGFAPGWFNTPADLTTQAHVAFAIMAVAIAVSIPFDTLGGALNAYGRIDLLSVSNLARALSAALGGALAAMAGGGVVAVTAVGACCGMATHLLRWRMLARLVPGLRLSPSLVDRSRLRTTLNLSGWFMLRDATSVVIERLDLLIVGIVLGVKAAAVYGIGLKLAQLGLRAVQPFTALFFPRASGLSAEGDREGLAALLVAGTRVTLAVAMPIMLVLSLLAEPAITAWVGSGFHDAVAVLILLAVARGLAAVTETAWWLLGGAGWVKWTSSLSLVEAVVNLSSSVLLARAMGPAGVALGTLIGVVVARLPVAFGLAGRATGLPVREIAAGAVLPHLAPIAATAGALVAVRSWVPANPAAVIGAATGGMVLYVLVYLAAGASEAEVARVVSLVRGARRAGGRIPAARRAGEPVVLPDARPTGPVSVAVCVCTFQRPAGLARVLDALPGALPGSAAAGGPTGIQVRVIVVDNEVSPRNEAIVAARAARSPWSIEYVAEPTRGISYARNAAVRAALPWADFVAFVDDDEVPEVDWLPQLVAAQRRTGADVVMGPQRTVFDDRPPGWVMRGRFFRQPTFAEGQPLHYATTANVLIRAEMFALDDPPFSERLALAGGEDTRFFRQIHLAGGRIVWTNEAAVSEHVGTVRTNARWLVRREYRRGNTLGICLVDLEDSPYRRAKRTAHAALSMTKGVLLLLTAVVRGRVAVVRGAQRIAFGVGIVSGLVGRVYDEYADPNRYELPPVEILQ